MKSTQNKKRISYRKTIIAATIASLSMPVLAAYEGPFAATPLNLQNSTTTTTSGGVKPNVVLQVDDSGSMASGVWDNGVVRTRMAITKRALTNLLNNAEFRDKINWSMITIDGTDESLNSWNTRFTGNRQYPALDPSYHNQSSWKFAQDPNTILNRVNKMYSYSYTPSTSRYFDSVFLLKKALRESGVYRCQKSYVVLFSDGEPNDSSITMASDGSNFYPDAGYRASEIRWGVNDTRDLRRYGYGNPARNLITFRKPSNMSSTDWTNAFRSSTWQNSASGMRALADSVYYDDFMTSADGVDAAGKSWDDPAVNGGKQNIVTFSIGFGLNSSYLDAAATGNSYKAFVANNEAQLTAAFRSIFDTINSQNLNAPPESFSTVSPVINPSDTDKSVANMAATAKLNLSTGSSELRFYGVSSGKVNTSKYQLPSFNNRKAIAHRNGTNMWFDASLSGGSNTLFSLVGGSNNNEWKDTLIPWFLRQGSSDASLNKTTNSQQYRERTVDATADTRNMGDIVGAPVLATSPYNNGKLELDTAGRLKYLFTAANDGMVYLFKSEPTNTTNPYDLKLNYLPLTMQRESSTDVMEMYLKDVAHKDYITTNPHRYMINGGMVYRATDTRASEQIFLLGNMGQGGRGAFALNVGGFERGTTTKVGIDAAQNDWLTKVPLFETSKGTSNTMGYTVGTPQIGRVAAYHTDATGSIATGVNRADVRYAAFVGSGIFNPNAGLTGLRDGSETALYVYNMLGSTNVGINPAASSVFATANSKGAEIRKITVGETNRGGLLQPTLVDVNFDGIVDIAYAGDHKGGMWRFDLRHNPSKWTAHKIFQAQNNQPITSAPAIYRINKQQYVVIFGTGRDLLISDLSDSSQQSVYGVYDDISNLSPTAKTIANLVEQTMTESSPASGVKVRTMTDNAKQDSQAGWYFNLASKERVVVKPDIVLKTAIITTRSYDTQSSSSGNTSSSPTTDVCISTTQSVKSTSTSWIMQVKVDNGGQIPARGGSNEYAYIDFLNQGTAKQRAATIYAGYQFLGLVSQTPVAYNGYNAAAIGNYGNSTTVNGDAGGSGKDPDLSNNDDNTSPKACIVKGKGTIYAQTSDAGLVQDPFNLYGAECTGGNIRRISWREVF